MILVRCVSNTFYTLRFCLLNEFHTFLLFAKRDQKIIFLRSEKSEHVRIPYRSAMYWLATSNHPELPLALREVLISVK